MFLIIIKTVYDKSVANIVLSDKKLKAFPKILSLTISIQHSTGYPSYNNN